MNPEQKKNKTLKDALMERRGFKLHSDTLGDVTAYIRAVQFYHNVTATGLIDTGMFSEMLTQYESDKESLGVSTAKDNLASMIEGKDTKQVEALFVSGGRRAEVVLVKGIRSLQDEHGNVYRMVFADQDDVDIGTDLTVTDLRAFFGDAQVEALQARIESMSDLPSADEAEAMRELDPSKFHEVSN